MTLEQFGRRFGTPAPTFQVTVPGRVNLIGEHIDYAGLTVLPMAVQRRVSLFVRPRADRTICVANADTRYEDVTFTIDADIPPYAQGHWGNYVKAAVQHLERQYGALCGFDAFVHSDLPPAMGLSSSSAIVVGVGLSAATAAVRAIPSLELAAALAEAERYVGTQGGGMDQTVCLLARAGHASLIDFDPLGAVPVRIPEAWRFIVASSLIPAEKSGPAQDAYNRRRRDVELAVQAVAAAAESDGGSLKDLMGRHSPDALVDLGEAVLDAEVAKRFRHVVREAVRVREAARAMEDNDREAFGRLMVESHVSLRDDFAVSSAALDAIVEIAQRSGALGARLTGAGFGGCAVVLTEPDAEAAVCGALRDAFYASRGVTDVSGVLFRAEPSDGAQVHSLAGGVDGR